MGAWVVINAGWYYTKGPNLKRGADYDFDDLVKGVEGNLQSAESALGSNPTHLL